MVAAAGNQGTSDHVDYPARFNETIGVTATTKDGSIASFSNTGKEVDIAAPGEKISSAWLNTTIRDMSGTSMAVPHVSGTAALLLYLRPDLTPDHVKDLMIQATTPIKGCSDYGKLSSYRSIQYLAYKMGRFIP